MEVLVFALVPVRKNVRAEEPKVRFYTKLELSDRLNCPMMQFKA